MMLANHKVPIFNYKVLPADLDDADLMAVCRAVSGAAGGRSNASLRPIPAGEI